MTQFFTSTNSMAVRIAKEAANWEEAQVFNNIQEKQKQRVVCGIAHVLEQDKEQGAILAHKHDAPMICCYYWGITLPDRQEIILRYCTTEEKVCILIKRDRDYDDSSHDYVLRLSGAIAVLAQDCKKCK